MLLQFKPRESVPGNTSLIIRENTSKTSSLRMFMDFLSFCLSSILWSLILAISSRIFVGSWNVGGVAPPDDLNMEDWLCTHTDPADIYVLGLVSRNPFFCFFFLRNSATKTVVLILYGS